MEPKDRAKMTNKLSSSFEDSLLLLVPRKATIIGQNDCGVEYVLDGQTHFISLDSDLKLTFHDEPKFKRRKIN